MSAPMLTLPTLDSDSRTGGRFPGAVAAEWTKFWTLRSTWLCLLGATFILAAFTTVVAMATRLQREEDQAPLASVPIGSVGVTALQIVQFATIALAILAVCSEYQTGSIRATLIWVPKRGSMVLSKSFVVGIVTLGSGVVFGLIGDGIAWAALGPYRMGDMGDVLRDTMAVSVYLTALALFSVGLGFVIRSTAGTFAVVLLLLLGLPAAFQAVDNAVLNGVAHYLPMSAGGYLIDRATEPYGAVTAIVVLAAWAIGSVVVGTLVLRRRDA